MSDFKAKMRQIRFPLRPRPGWGSLQRSPDPLAVFKASSAKEMEGGEEGRRQKKRGGARGRG